MTGSTLRRWVATVVLVCALGPWIASAGGSTPNPNPAPQCGGMSTANSPLTGFSATSRPVVLVHGWNGSASKMVPIANALKNLPVTSYLFDYQAHNTTWAAKPVIASCLATYIDAVSAGYKSAGGDGKTIVVAHSMGGLATLFSASSKYAATPDDQALGGVVTVDTPFLGSPFGSQAVSRAFEALPGVGGAHPTSLFQAPAGSDASICLAAHQPPSNTLPNGCALAPYLPPGVPLTELAGDMSVKRTLLGIPLYTVDLGTDGPVPVSSAQGYVASGANGRDPNRRQITPLTISCMVDFDQIGSIAAAQGVVQGGQKGLFSGLTDLLSPDIFTDSDALDQLQSGKMGRQLDAFLGAAYLAAPCSHGGTLTDPASLQAIVSAVKGDLAQLSPTAPTPPASSVASFQTPADDDPTANTASDGWVFATIDQNNWTTYDLTTGDALQTVSDPQLKSCGAGVAHRTDGIDVVLTLDSTTSAAAGVTSQSTSYTLVGTSAESGAQLWQTPLGATDPCAYDDTNPGYANLGPYTQTSPNGATALWPSGFGAAGTTFLINLTSGHVTTLDGPSIMIGATVAVAESPLDEPDKPVGALYDANTDAPSGSTHSAALVACAHGNYGCAVAQTPAGDAYVANVGNDIVGTQDAPDGNQLWRQNGAANVNFLDSGGPVVIEPATVGGSTGLSAISPTTGRTVWRNADGDFCGATSGKVFVSVNDQLAVLDATTGKQLSYDPSQSQCPTVLPGAIVEQGQDDNTVVPEAPASP